MLDLINIYHTRGKQDIKIPAIKVRHEWITSVKMTMKQHCVYGQFPLNALTADVLQITYTAF